MSSFDQKRKDKADLVAFFGPGFQWLMGNPVGDGTTTKTSNVRVGADDGLRVGTGGQTVIRPDENNEMRSAYDVDLKANADGATLAGTSSDSVKIGEHGSSDALGWLFGWTQDGPTAMLSSSESQTNGVTTDGRKVDMGWANGGYQARVGTQQSVAFDKNNSTSQSRDLAFKGDQLSFTTARNERWQDDPGGAVQENGQSTTFGYGANGPQFMRTDRDVVEHDGQSIATEQSRGFQNGQFTQSNLRTVSDGNEKVTSGTEFGVGKDKASGAYTNVTTAADGSSTGHKAAGEIDLANNAASGSYTYANTGPNGEDNGSVNVGGKAGFNDNGDLNNASMTLGGSYKGMKASVSGEYKVDAGEPKEQDGVWVVDYSRTVSGSAQGGAKGITIGGKKSQYDFGTRTFKTEGEAKKFQANAASMLPSKAVDPTTANGALAMEVGEARGVGDASSVGISGELQMNVTSLGAGYESGSNSSTKIERVNENVFLVTRASGDNSTLSGTAGIGPAGVTISSSDEASKSQTVKFDLATTVGRAAFEEYNRTGKLPEEGAEKISETEAKKHRQGTGISIGSLGSASISATTFESTTRDATTGTKTDVFGGENADSVSWLGDEGSGRFRLLQTEINDEQRNYTLQAFTESSEGWWNRQHLANYTGYGGDGGNGTDKASGKWRVDMEMTEADVQAFVERKLENERQDENLFGEDERVTLTRRLHDAKDTDDMMRAMASYVADDGFEGDARRHFEDMLGHKLRMDVALDGDRNFKGAGARYELEGKIGRYQAMMAETPGAAAPLVTTIQADLDEIKRRKAEILDLDRYTDMPMELRLMEAAKYDTHMNQLLALRTTAATEATKLNPGQNWGDTENAVRDEMADIEATEDPELKRLKRLRHEIQGLDISLAHNTSEIDSARADVDELFKVMDLSKQTLTSKSAAWKSYQAGKQMVAGAEELRAQFVLNFANPQVALAVGQSLKVLLTVANGLHDDAYVKMNEALDGAATEALDWHESTEYDPDNPSERYLALTRDQKRAGRRNAVLERRGYLDG